MGTTRELPSASKNNTRGIDLGGAILTAKRNCGLQISRGNIRRRFVACLLAAFFLVYGTGASAQTTVPVIDTVAGGGTPAGNGDGGPATSARLDYPLDVAIDASGNLYIAEWYAFRVRKVTPAGVISTVAGNGSQAYNGDGIPATAAAIDVRSIAVDSAGNLYIADGENGRIRKVSTNGIISTVIDSLYFPSRVAVGPQNVIYVVSENRVLKKSGDGVIRVVAGNGQYGFSGDGGLATAAMLSNPEGISFDALGNLYIADYGNNRIRRVTKGGVISTVAGGGPFGNDPVAKSIHLLYPHDVAVDSRGNIYIAEQYNVVRVVSAHGFIRAVIGQFDDTTFENTGAGWGFAGDGGPATEALIYEPTGLALDSQENLYLVDSQNNRIRRVTTVPTPLDLEGANAFGASRAYEVGSSTNNVAIADVNNDGLDDALLTTSTAGFGGEPDKDYKLLVFLQKVNGSLGTPLRYALPGNSFGITGAGIAADDLNRDGFADVIVGTTNGIVIFRGTLTGLAAGIEYGGFDHAERVHDVAIMDVNRDGNPDVVAGGGGSSEGGTSPSDKFGLTVFYGNGVGGISSRIFHPNLDRIGWSSIRTSDIDGDGLLDLIGEWSQGLNNGTFSGGFEVTYHDGVDGFRSPVRIAAEQPRTWGGYAVGDFNSDGRKDAVVSTRASYDAAYAYLQQLADGTFSQVRQWRAFESPAEMLSADMNGDGRDDLIVLHEGRSALGYQQQTSSGLGTEIKYSIKDSGNQNFPSLAVGDLNHDGCKDVALADHQYGLVVLPGQNCIVARSANGSQPLKPPPHHGLYPDTTVPGAEPLPGRSSAGLAIQGEEGEVRGVVDTHGALTMFHASVGWIRRFFPPWVLLPMTLGVFLGTTLILPRNSGHPSKRHGIARTPRG